MKFKKHKRRRPMEHIRRVGKNKIRRLINRGIRYYTWKDRVIVSVPQDMTTKEFLDSDFDLDGVENRKDCRPFNPKQHFEVQVVGGKLKITDIDRVNYRYDHSQLVEKMINQWKGLPKAEADRRLNEFIDTQLQREYQEGLEAKGGALLRGIKKRGYTKWDVLKGATERLNPSIYKPIFHSIRMKANEIAESMKDRTNYDYMMGYIGGDRKEKDLADIESIRSSGIREGHNFADAMARSPERHGIVLGSYKGLYYPLANVYDWIQNLPSGSIIKSTYYSVAKGRESPFLMEDLRIKEGLSSYQADILEDGVRYFDEAIAENRIAKVKDLVGAGKMTPVDAWHSLFGPRFTQYTINKIHTGQMGKMFESFWRMGQVGRKAYTPAITMAQRKLGSDILERLNTPSGKIRPDDVLIGLGLIDKPVKGKVDVTLPVKQGEEI